MEQSHTFGQQFGIERLKIGEKKIEGGGAV